MWPPEDPPQRVDPAPWLQLEEQRPRRGHHQTGDSCNILRHGHYITLVTILLHVIYSCHMLHVAFSMLHCAQVRPVCLPSPTTDYDSRQATVTGWGTTAQGGLLSSMLQKVIIYTIFLCDETVSLHSICKMYYCTSFQCRLNPCEVWKLVLQGGQIYMGYWVHQNRCSTHRWRHK